MAQPPARRARLDGEFAATGGFPERRRVGVEIGEWLTFDHSAGH
jgi:hypothetical protein